MKKTMIRLCMLSTLAVLTGCLGSKSLSQAGRGGEVVGVGGSRPFAEPTPYGMVKVDRGYLHMGLDSLDSLWGRRNVTKDVSVEGFWMDETEVTNAKYRQFVMWVRDSILRTRLADPAYAGDETYLITEDKNGEAVTPRINWKKPLPRRPNEDELRAIESLYVTNPVTGEKLLDWRQMNYKYEVYDYMAAALRRHRLNPEERQLNTDVTVNPDEVVMISKDTAYIDDAGRVVSATIDRQLTGPWDFLNTYPDTPCWVNDFTNSDNELYLRSYFSNAAYNDYPVVGVTWEQANAFCAWRTNYLLAGLGPEARFVQRYRLPTEAEWEYAARGKEGNEFPWDNKDMKNGRGCFYANFKPDRGNYTADGNLITSKVGTYGANSNGLFDMAGNVAEWTGTIFTESGLQAMNDLNPTLRYNAAKEDPYRLKKKSVRGGSWKDPESFIRSAWRTWEYQNQPRAYIGFRCVRSLANSTTSKQPKSKK